MSKIVVSMAGWCEADPDKVRFQSLNTQDRYITGTEWLQLNEEAREGFILERTAFANALDGAEPIPRGCLRWHSSVRVFRGF
jgi:hypothetical protein